MSLFVRTSGSFSPRIGASASTRVLIITSSASASSFPCRLSLPSSSLRFRSSSSSPLYSTPSLAVANRHTIQLPCSVSFAANKGFDIRFGSGLRGIKTASSSLHRLRLVRAQFTDSNNSNDSTSSTTTASGLLSSQPFPFNPSVTGSTISLRTMSSASVPTTMKGVLVEKTGGVEVLDYKTDLPVPKLKEGEVLVKNDMIGINYIDTYFRTGLYPSTKPEILGREGEGTIVAVSGNTGKFKEGDRVVYMGTSAYAEYTAVAATSVFSVPASLPRGIASAALLQGLTTLTLIDDAYEVKAGDWILVHAAAGGVGQWLVQVLAARNAYTIATASTPEKRELASKLGANVTVGYGHDEVVAAVKKATDGRGVAGVFDGVGKDTFDTSLESLARKGTLVSFGNASGPVPPLTIARLSAKNAKVARPTLFNYLVTDEEKEKYSSELWALLEAEKVKVGIHKTYPLSEVRQAHTDLEGRATSGKLLLDPSK